MAPGGGDGRRNSEQQQANGGKHGCVCGFPVCACAGAAAVASAASSADMDRVAVAATEGQIGAVNDESWVAVDLSDDLSGDGADDGVAIEDRRGTLQLGRVALRCLGCLIWGVAGAHRLIWARRAWAFVGVVRGDTEDTVGGGTNYRLLVVAAADSEAPKT